MQFKSLYFRPFLVGGISLLFVYRASGVPANDIKPTIPAPLIAPVGSEQNPIYVEIHPVPLILDGPKTSLLFLKKSEGGRSFTTDPCEIAFDVDVRGVGHAGETTLPLLPFPEEKVPQFLAALRTSAGNYIGRNWSDSDLKREVVYYQYTPRHLQARISVRPIGGWQPGAYHVGANFDSNELLRSLHYHVQVPPSSQAVDVRVTLRTPVGAEDERLKARFKVWQHFQFAAFKPPLAHSAQEDIQALLAQFPDDMYGHAYAGMLAASGEGDEYFIGMQLKMVRQNGRLVPEPDTLKRVDTALAEYQLVQSAVSKAIVAGLGDQQVWPQELPNTPEFQALHMDNWEGYQGPRELCDFLDRTIASLHAAREALASGVLLSESDIKDADSIIDFLRQDTPVAVGLRTSLQRTHGKLAYNLGHNLPLGEEKAQLIYALNNLITGPWLDQKVPLTSVVLNERTRAVFVKGAQPGEPYNRQYDRQREFNRRFLDIIFVSQLVHLN